MMKLNTKALFVSTLNRTGTNENGYNKPSYIPSQCPIKSPIQMARKEAGQPVGSDNFIRS